MKRFVTFVGVIFVLASSLFAQQSADTKKADNHKFNKAEFFQGTSTGQKKAGSTVKGTLFFDSESKEVSFLQESGSPAVTIKYDTIKAITYEKASKPRYAAAVLVSPLFLLSHGKKHYLTIQYTGEDTQGKYAIVRLDKSNAREAIACAEAQTGVKVEQIEEK
jgi:hypothetical protein